MDEMITFDKTFEERYEEYIVVFGNSDTIPASQIKRQWSIYLEFELDACRWNALWKIPKYLCDKLYIPYPTVVIVDVNSINFDDLTAEVEVIAVQGNLDLPLLHTASLTRLWPTKKQNECVDIMSIANTLDMYRFFYYHLWMPWDIQENNHFDWVRNNLADRLHLFYNIKDRKIPNNKARKFRKLLNDVKHALEILNDDGTSSKCINISDYTQDSNLTAILIDLHLKIVELKTEIEILRMYHSEIESNSTKALNYWLVFNSGFTLEKYSQFLYSVTNESYNKTKYKSAISLQDALDSANCNDTIIIGEGKHSIFSAAVLDEGAILKSNFEDKSEVIVESLHENIFIDFSGTKLLLENLSVSIPRAQCGIIAQNGSILIKNCSFFGQGLSSSQHGIIALPGVNITLENCQISGFEIGFFISSSASLTLRNCKISDIHTPIKICANAVLNLDGCKFENYRQNIADFSSIESRINATIVDCNFVGPEPLFIELSQRINV